MYKATPLSFAPVTSLKPLWYSLLWKVHSMTVVVKCQWTYGLFQGGQFCPSPALDHMLASSLGLLALPTAI